jgi:hypothetical protein
MHTLVNVVGVWMYAYTDDEEKSTRRYAIEYRGVMAVN